MIISPFFPGLSSRSSYPPFPCIVTPLNAPFNEGHVAQRGIDLGALLGGGIIGFPAAALAGSLSAFFGCGCACFLLAELVRCCCRSCLPACIQQRSTFLRSQGQQLGVARRREEGRGPRRPRPAAAVAALLLADGPRLLGPLRRRRGRVHDRRVRRAHRAREAERRVPRPQVRKGQRGEIVVFEPRLIGDQRERRPRSGAAGAFFPFFSFFLFSAVLVRSPSNKKKLSHALDTAAKCSASAGRRSLLAGPSSRSRACRWRGPLGTCGLQSSTCLSGCVVVFPFFHENFRVFFFKFFFRFFPFLLLSLTLLFLSPTPPFPSPGPGRVQVRHTRGAGLDQTRVAGRGGHRE